MRLAKCGGPTLRDFPDVVDEEALEEVLDFGGLGSAKAKAEDGRPGKNRELFEEMTRASSQGGLLEIGLEAEFVKQLHLEGKHGLRPRRVPWQFIEEVREILVEGRKGGFGFGRLLDEHCGIRSLLNPAEVFAETRMSQKSLGFAKVVELGS